MWLRAPCGGCSAGRDCPGTLSTPGRGGSGAVREQRGAARGGRREGKALPRRWRSSRGSGQTQGLVCGCLCVEPGVALGDPRGSRWRIRCGSVGCSFPPPPAVCSAAAGLKFAARSGSVPQCHSCGFLLHLWFQRSLPALFGHPFTKSPRRFNFSQKPLHTQLLLLSFACPCQLASKELCCSPGRQRGPWGCPQPTLLGQELCGSPGSPPAPSEPFLWCCFSSGRWEGLLPGSSFPICGSCLSSSPGLWFSHISWEGGGSVLP